MQIDKSQLGKIIGHILFRIVSIVCVLCVLGLGAHALISSHPLSSMRYGFFSAIFAFTATIFFTYKSDRYQELRLPFFFLLIGGNIGYISLVMGNEQELVAVSKIMLTSSVFWGGMIGLIYAFCLYKITHR
jgi:hypothetical protein